MSAYSASGKFKICFKPFYRSKLNIIWITIIGITLLICVNIFSRQRSNDEMMSGGVNAFEDLTSSPSDVRHSTGIEMQPVPANGPNTISEMNTFVDLMASSSNVKRSTEMGTQPLLVNGNNTISEINTFADLTASSSDMKYSTGMETQPVLVNGTSTISSIEVKGKNTLEPLTLHCNEGRFGNQMCTLAVLKGIAALNNRTISILPCNKKGLDPYFDLKEPEISKTFTEREPYSIGVYPQPNDRKISSKTNIIKGYPHPCSFTFFNHIRQDIKKTFRFREKFVSNAQQVLTNIKGNQTNVTFVGVHVRRGDYVTRTRTSWLWAYDGREVDKEYFEKATKYFRDRYPNVEFVVVSEDLPWCRENLKGFTMHIPEKSLGPAYDMALLTQCNHTIMTYGTFGFWGGYLAGGDVVYFDKFLKPGTAFLQTQFSFEKMYLPEWIGIDTTKPGFWEKYVRPPLDQ